MLDRDIAERTRLAGSNKFELLLFRLGEGRGGQRELFGINVFKVREVLVMPPITELANAHQHLRGVANIRGQIIPVIDLPAVMGCTPHSHRNILMVTEFARTVQGFAVEDVREIVRLEWNQVEPSEASDTNSLITGIARVDGDATNTRLAQVLDVEQIIKNVLPATQEDVSREVVGPALVLPPNCSILVADDSVVARSVIEIGLKAMGVSFHMTKTGREAWERLQTIADTCEQEGRKVHDQIALVLTDLEMPEMDGFTLTRLIKQDPRFSGVPVIIHSSLTGVTNENHVRNVGADGYVGKFAPRELATAIRHALEQRGAQ